MGLDSLIFAPYQGIPEMRLEQKTEEDCKENSIPQNCKNTQKVAGEFKRINVTQFLTITPRHL